MPTFPVFRSGAVAQYGSGVAFGFRTRVHRFLDGSEQTHRWRTVGGRRWSIAADQLDEGELARVEEFFAEMRGAEGRFDFTDPASGEVVSNCSFASDELPVHYAGVQRGTVRLFIRENLT